jgi:16S rRNA (guanine527-N7)-methyltransferase
MREAQLDQKIAFKQGIVQLGLSLNDHQQDQLIAYGDEFRKWNKIHNLSAIDQEEAFLKIHLMDSLATITYLKALIDKDGILPLNPCIADLGAGGGLPGIPLAIALPDWQFVLVEAVKKKAAFLQHIKGKLRLDNVEIIGERIELYANRRPHFADATISRAFTELKNFVNYSKDLIKKDGLVLAMKSQKAEIELAEIPDGWALLKNISLEIPGLQAQRCLLILQSVRK